MSDDVLHLSGPVLLGPDDVRPEAWVVGDRLTLERPAAAGHDVTRIEGWALPGLVDAHCHVGLGADGAVDRDTQERQITADRDAGTLLVRDAGSPADTRWIDDRPDLPRLVRAGRHIARTRRYLRGYGDEVEPEQLVDAVRHQASRGDGWVKLVGDWIDRATGDLAPCWPADALHAAVAAAHDVGARVTAHCFGEDCLPDLLDAGLDCIEHGTGLTDATVAAAAARGVPVVPTLVNIATFPGIADRGRAKFPRYAAHMDALHGRRYATVGAAHDAGVPLRVGTDAGGVLPHGLVVDEIEELARVVGPAAALDAGCWSARRWLGRPEAGEGADADLLVVPGDPRTDPAVLRHPVAVLLRGRRTR